jgi:hypothetical protein
MDCGSATLANTTSSCTSNEYGNPLTVMGGGWANVWVNGEKQAKTAPMTLELKPGSYSIRVANAAIGVDQTESITVSSGGTAKVTAKPQ